MTIADLQKLEAAATKGPWMYPVVGNIVDSGGIPVFECLDGRDADLCLMVAARNHFAALLEVAKAAKLEHAIIKNFVLAIIMGETVLHEKYEQGINEAVDAMNAALDRLEAIK